MRMHLTSQMCDVLENRQDTHNLHQENTAIDDFDRCKSQKTLIYIHCSRSKNRINHKPSNMQQARGGGVNQTLNLIAKS
jgi:hypothetical protein